LQRLFSTFANGWPGVGLLLQRLVTAIVLVHYAVVSLRGPSESSSNWPQLIGAGIGMLLVLGLWTPIAGMALALIELWIGLGNTGDPWIPVLLAMLGVTLAMIGPGAWSLDARLFGRKHIAITD
jgi:putative oxidoreductase